VRDLECAMRKTGKRCWLVILVLCLPIVGYLVYPPRESWESKFGRVQKGMPRSEVNAILGKATDDTDKNDVTWGDLNSSVEIIFDQETGLVKQKWLFQDPMLDDRNWLDKLWERLGL
jgi:hypothetical protein